MATRKFKPAGVYGRSKLANILFANELAKQLEGVTVNSLHPGVVRTNLGREGDLAKLSSRIIFSIIRLFFIGPERGARTSIYLASAPELEGKTGGYYAKSKLAKTTEVARDEAVARRLWEVSEALVEEGKAMPRPEPKPKSKSKFTGSL